MAIPIQPFQGFLRNFDYFFKTRMYSPDDFESSDELLKLHYFS
jgi:hypothetical protein